MQFFSPLARTFFMRINLYPKRPNTDTHEKKLSYENSHQTSVEIYQQYTKVEVTCGGSNSFHLLIQQLYFITTLQVWHSRSTSSREMLSLCHFYSSSFSYIRCGEDADLPCFSLFASPKPPLEWPW